MFTQDHIFNIHLVGRVDGSDCNYLYRYPVGRVDDSDCYYLYIQLVEWMVVTVTTYIYPVGRVDGSDCNYLYISSW